MPISKKKKKEREREPKEDQGKTSLNVTDIP